MQTNIGTILPSITGQILSYIELNDNLYSDFTKVLGCIVPKYRKGDIEESEFKERIKALYHKLQELYLLIQEKLKEVQQIGIFMKAVKEYDLMSADSHFYCHYEYIVCLEFNESQLIHYVLQENTSPWYQDKK